jgi:thiol:disulfide interchange protein DsbA
MFDEIHKQRKKFRNIEDIAKWYAENFDVDEKEFLSTANSFMIDSKIRQSDNLMKKMQVSSTPSIVVNGKYKPNVRTLGSNTAVLELARYFANKEAVDMGLIK